MMSAVVMTLVYIPCIILTIFIAICTRCPFPNLDTCKVPTVFTLILYTVLAQPHSQALSFCLPVIGKKKILVVGGHVTIMKMGVTEICWVEGGVEEGLLL